MIWNQLEGGEDQVDALLAESALHPVVVFKHSTRCSISSMVLNRFERAFKEPDTAKPAMYLLDLIRYRALSNALADRLKVEHESPQVMVLFQGNVVHHASHTGIDWTEIASSLQA